LLPIFLSNLISNNDESELEKIYKEYHGLMFYIAKGILKDHAMVEDSVSESLMKTYRNLHVLKKLTCYQKQAYIVNIVRNTSLDFLRKNDKDKVIVDDSSELLEEIPDGNVGILDGIIIEEGCKSIKEAVKSLPKPLQDVLYLSAVCELTHYEISEELGISYDASKMKLCRAKKEIKKKLAGENNGK